MTEWIPMEVKMCFDHFWNRLPKTVKRKEDLAFEVFRAVMSRNLRLKYEFDDDTVAKLIDCGLILDKYSKDMIKHLVEIAEDRISKANELERKVLAFFLNLKPEYWYDSGEFCTLGTFQRLTVIFDRMFDECLLAEEHLTVGHSNLVFWELGDIMVKLGIGYWIPYISSSYHVYLDFVIPKFLFDVLKRRAEALPKIDGFDE